MIWIILSIVILLVILVVAYFVFGGSSEFDLIGITYDGTLVLGTSNSNKLLTTNINQVIDVSAGPVYMWAVAENNDVYRCKHPCTGDFKKVDGRLTTIDAASGKVIGTGPTQPGKPGGWVYISDIEPVNWKPISNLYWTNASIGANHIFGVDNTNKGYYCRPNIQLGKPTTCSPTFVDNARDFDVAGPVVWETASNGKVYTIPESNVSAKYPVNSRLMSTVSANDKYVWGIDVVGNVQRCAAPCNGNWTPVQGKLKSIDVKN